MLRYVYQLIANLFGPALVLGASFKGRFGGRWRERLGLKFAPHRSWDRPRLWFHVASVGETRSAASVIKAYLEIRPQAEIYLSVGTPAGLEVGEALFRADPRVKVIAAPLDFWGSTGRALSRLNPDGLVILETELWPQLIFEAKSHGARLILAASRLSARSFNRYRLVRTFMREILNSFDLIAPCGQLEFEMFAALGAPPARMKVLGNPKFDRLLEEAGSDEFRRKTDQWQAELWGEQPTGRLIVAGSTHPGEEAALLAAYAKLSPGHSDLKLIIAPRHLNRVGEVLTLAQDKGFRAAAASQTPAPAFGGSEVLVLDSLGQLSALYSLADIVLVGGSLIKGLLGHNPLEPAAVAAPLLFGPYMDSFKIEAQQLLAAGGAAKTSAETLNQDLGYYLQHPGRARNMAQAALDTLRNRPQSAPALAQAIDKTINTDL